MGKVGRFVLPVAALLVGACSATTDLIEKRLSSRGTGEAQSADASRQAGRFGAIAFSDSTQIWRFRWNVVDQQRAIDLVLRDCGQTDCRLLLTYGPTLCGTFAMGADGKTAAAAGNNARESEVAARAACNSISRGCKVAPAQCNT